MKKLFGVLILILISVKVSFTQDKAVLSWDASTDPSVVSYKLYQGTATHIYDLPIPVGLTTSYTTGTLTSGTRYFFVVTAVNSSNIESVYTQEINVLFGSAFTGISAAGISDKSATITWGTSSPRDSLVRYGTTTTYNNKSTKDSSLVTSHAVNLVNLTPSTLYHYEVVSSDANGNMGVSADNTFTTGASTDTTPPVISNIVVPINQASNFTVAWDTDELSDSQVEYGLTTSYGTSSTLNATRVINHSQNIGGLTTGTLYHYRVKSRDFSGNLQTSADQTNTTAGDLVPPSLVSIISPMNNAVVFGSVTVTGTAVDNVALAGLQFKLDGVNLGSEDTTFPYSVVWNSMLAEFGAHTLAVVARDTSNNTTTSPTINVTVNNYPPVPTNFRTY